jgi:hypothetical protein
VVLEEMEAEELLLLNLGQLLLLLEKQTQVVAVVAVVDLVVQLVVQVVQES